MIPAQKCECPAATGQSANQTTQHGDFSPTQKRIATLRARAAMAGVTLCVFPDECTGETVYIVSRWNLTKQLESIADAEAWLTKVTGAAHAK